LYYLSPLNMNNRRQFIKNLTIGAAAGSLAGCRQTVNRSIPYLIQPEEIVPGESLHYATTYYDGYTYGSVMARVMNGRPVKIDGNSHSSLTLGGSNVRLQASLFGLYQPGRCLYPLVKHVRAGWADFFSQTSSLLKQPDKDIVLFCRKGISPTEDIVMNDFLSRFPNIRKIEYDTVSCKSVSDSHNQVFGRPIQPLPVFNQVNILLTFSGDLLVSSPLPEYITRHYCQNRTQLRHFHFDCCSSLTGNKADKTFCIHPDEERVILANLYNYFAVLNRMPAIECPEHHILSALPLADTGAQNLLVISSSADPEVQRMICRINYLAGAYSKFLKPEYHINLRTAQPAEIVFSDKTLFEQSDIFIFYDCDPVTDSLLDAEEWKKRLADKPVIALVHENNRSSALAGYIAPVQHPYEMWGDAMAVNGFYSFQQPLVVPAGESVHRASVLLSWMDTEQDITDYIQQTWMNLFERTDNFADFIAFRNHILQNGVLELPVLPVALEMKETFYQPVFNRPGGIRINILPSPVTGDKMEINPFLNEIPDPVYGTLEKDIVFSNHQDYTLFKRNGISHHHLYDPNHASDVITGYYASPFHRFCVSSGFRFTSDDMVFSKERRSPDRFIPEISASMLEAQQDYLTVNPSHVHEQQNWIMSVDLHRCTGCGACMIACQIENNIPPVGMTEALKGRLMHWIKIGKVNMADGRRMAIPLLCQQCHQAPCESVCPVAATMHSTDGINQMVYNRCIGARYCNNNCPYHARVFNFYDYASADPLRENDPQWASSLQKTFALMRNADVTVRSKGVMEKCNFCFHRIHKARADARTEGRLFDPTDVNPACAAACPAGAIIFGDRNQNDSKARRLFESENSRFLLAKLNTSPSVAYLCNSFLHYEKD